MADGTQEPRERYARDVVLRDGQTIYLRPIRRDDLDAMVALWGRLSPETIRLRFFQPLEMDALRMRYLVEVDDQTSFAMVAVVGERIVGVGRFERSPEDPSTADFAVTVEDAEHGRGIGTALLRSLMAPARDLGICRFHGDILFENDTMLSVLRDAGFEPVLRDYGGVVSATFKTTPSQAFLERAGEDDRTAAIAAFRSVLHPASVAVVASNPADGSTGRVLLSNLQHGGFRGAIYPVFPDTVEVDGLPCYPTLGDCPEPPELVVVCVRAPSVEQIVREAGQIGARTAIVISSGFAEAGAEGRARQDAVLAAARQHGIRVLGPNSMGVVNPDPAVRLNASFSPRLPPSGRIGFSSQSGALGLAVLAAAERTDLGLSTFVSVGNKADLSGNDVLQYWEADAETDVILLYLESFGNPRTFARIARRVSREKPIVVVKAGRTIAGTRRGEGQAGGVSSDVAARALFEQAGVVQVETLREMFDVTALLTSQPLPAGDGLAVLTNANGPALLATDAAVTYGLRLAKLAPPTLRALEELLGGRGVAANPVDLGVSGGGDDYAAAMRILARDPGVDAILVAYVPPLPGREDRVAAGISAAVRDIPDVTIASVFMTQLETPEPLRAIRMPAFTFPESAAAALAHVARYAAWRRRDPGQVAEVTEPDRQAARAVADEALRTSRRPDGAALLSAPQCAELLAVVGITQARSRHVTSAKEAARAAQQLAGPVAVKSAAPIDKSAAGAVRLGLSRPHQVAEAVRSMTRALTEAGMADAVEAGWVVQEMVADGLEVVAGMREHPSFGPVMEVALGGVIPELLGDVSRRIHPLTDVDAETMLTSLRGYPLLTGYRGAERVDVLALKRLLRQLSALVDAVPQMTELRLTPVFVRRTGVAVVDSHIRLRAQTGARPHEPDPAA